MFKSKGLWIFLGIIIVLGIWVVGYYNGFVQSKLQVEEKWSQVENQYQRRADLIPNLISTVKGAADFEQSTFIAVTEARTQWLNAGNRTEQIAAANSFDSALSRLLVTVENYPQLRATEGFIAFQSQLEGTENRVSVERKRYNEEVKAYNTKVKVFPGFVFARIFNFIEEPFFEAVKGAETTPEVKFNFSAPATE